MLGCDNDLVAWFFGQEECCRQASNSGSGTLLDASSATMRVVDLPDHNDVSLRHDSDLKVPDAKLKRTATLPQFTAAAV